MSITIIYYSLISTLLFLKTTILHTPFHLYHLQIIFYFTAKYLIIVIVPQNMYTVNLLIIFVTAVKSYHGPSISKKLTLKFFKCLYGFRGHYMYNTLYPHAVLDCLFVDTSQTSSSFRRREMTCFVAG